MPEARKPFWKRLIEFRLLFVVNAVILVMLGLSFGREWMRNREIRQEIARLEAQAAALGTRNLEIADLNTAFRTESFIEREARLKLGMKKPGESVVVIQNGSQTVAAASVGGEEARTANDPRTLLAMEADVPELANPSKWWHYFFR